MTVLASGTCRTQSNDLLKFAVFDESLDRPDDCPKPTVVGAVLDSPLNPLNEE